LISAIINKIDKVIKNNGKSIEIWGDGKAKREFMYAGDFADLILDSIINFDKIPSIMNIGTGIEHSINDFYKMSARVMGWNGYFEYNLQKPVGIHQKLLCISEMEKLGWKSCTDLEVGIQKTYDYYLGTVK
jgi:GDP-L-fucose synthase